jgi:hypothetical protein
MPSQPTNGTIKPGEECTLSVQGFPDLLRREAKALAALDDLTLREAVINAVQLWVAVMHDQAAKEGMQGGYYLRAAAAVAYGKNGETQ